MNTRLLKILQKIFGFTVQNVVNSYTEAIQFNGEKFLHGMLTYFTETGKEYEIDYEFSSDELGGIIIFSTDVNAIISKLYPESSILKRHILSIWNSIKNIMLKNRILTKIIKGHDQIQGFSIGNFFKGRYMSNDKIYDETSSSIEIIGISFDLLCVVASELAYEFKQETVLVKSNFGHKIVLVKPTYKEI